MHFGPSEEELWVREGVFRTNEEYHHFLHNSWLPNQSTYCRGISDGVKEDEPCSGESFIFGGSVQWVKELFDQEAGGINGSLSTLINDDSGR